MTIAAQRTELELLQDQLDGMRAWHQALKERLATEHVSAAATREMRLDANRRIEALRRAQRALVARADRGVRESVELLATRPARAVLVHRSEWLRNKLSVGLAAEGVAVLAQLEDGADGLGTAVVEQPDLIVLEDRLPSVTGLDLVRHVRVFVPRAVIAAQVEDDRSVADMLDAGAQAVFSRRIPPSLIAEQVADYLRQRGEGPLLLA